MPTTSRSSPTTTRAVNEKRRPPLTTLATRLISTTRSWRSRPAGFTDRSGELGMGVVVAGGAPETLDAEAGLPDRLGERANVAVITVAAAIEHRFGDARRLGPLGERLSRAPGALGLCQRAQLGLEPAHRGQRVARGVVDQLRAQASVGAEHRYARPGGGARDLRPHSAAAPQAPAVSAEQRHARLPTLRDTCSPS